ncbi:MAG: flagellar export protein FliJ, partial [bacterium]
MKAFRFTLQSLLDAREAIEKVLEMKHSAARREFEKAQQRQRAMAAGIKKDIEYIASLSGTCVSYHAVSSFLKHVERAQAAIADQTQRVAGFEAKMEKCRNDLHAAMRGRKSLERLLEGEQEKWRDEQRR